MDNQNTIARKVSKSGIALHTGVRACLTIKPAEENSGIIFKRVDINGAPEVKAFVKNVVDVRRGTTISSGNAVVYTVEHILAALHAFEIDNAVIEMDGAEPPVFDGSGRVFAEMITEAGIMPQKASAKYLNVSTPIIIEEGENKLIVFPSDEFKITCIVAYGETPLDAQYISIGISKNSFVEEIAPARTFCMFRELEQLIAMGLVKGGSLDNAVVLHQGAIISNNGLRFPNEMVRHKTLDIIGDLYLTGRRVRAHIVAIKPGHPTNVKLAAAMLEYISK